MPKEAISGARRLVVRADGVGRVGRRAAPAPAQRVLDRGLHLLGKQRQQSARALDGLLRGHRGHALEHGQLLVLRVPGEGVAAPPGVGKVKGKGKANDNDNRGKGSDPPGKLGCAAVEV